MDNKHPSEGREATTTESRNRVFASEYVLHKHVAHDGQTYSTATGPELEPRKPPADRFIPLSIR